MRRTCEVPVLPAISIPSCAMRERRAVPREPLTTPNIPSRTMRRWVGLTASRSRGGTGSGMPDCARTRRGTTSSPDAMRDVMTASWSGVAST